MSDEHPTDIIGGPPGLTLQHVFEAWEKPLLFAATDVEGQLVLAVLVAEADGTDEWYLVPLGPHMFAQLIESSVDYRTAFQAGSAQGGRLLRHSPPAESTEVTLVAQVPDSYLPAVGAQYESASRQALGHLSHQDRVWARVSIDLRDPGWHRVPAKPLGNILRSLQSMVEAAAAAIEGHQGERGLYPAWITEAARLDAVSFYPGSFGVTLEQAVLPADDRLFPRPHLLAQSLARIITVLSSAPEDEQLGDALADLGQRFAGHYQLLLANLSNVDAGLSLSWAPPGGAPSRSTVDRGAVSQLIGAVTSLAEKTAEVLEVSGEVTTYSKDRRRFTIIDREDGSVYSGPLAASLNKDVVSVGAVYTARIRAMTRVNETTLEEKTEYRLIDLDPVE